MSHKRTRKKILQRAAPVLYQPGGGLMYVPPGGAQSVYNQQFYGNSLKNVPVGQQALFSPGMPLAPISGVNPGGMPIQYRFPVAVNTFPVDRSQGMADIPSFEQLRRLAKMYSGIGLCERFWLDMVPRMTLDIKLKKACEDAGAEAKNFQKEIAFFKNFFAKPDGKNDLHTWVRRALREQTQIDELYLYKHRTRGGKMLGLWIVDGSQVKPLLDDWGMQPDAPDYAYQQYPWGIPGMQYSADQMIHYQETPAAETPYGTSRVERIILEVNQALRKKRKDLAHFTEGNQPFSLMEVPESLNWTPDQIDAYEQSWNALIAGNAQQQVRTKFTQPGMKYIQVEQYQMLSDFDKFILNVCVACYGISMADLSFTEDVNKSSGESQEDMTYRRTIGPLASMYGIILTEVMNTDFPDELHGEMFEATFGGYEEIEDEQAKANALTTYTGAGILGITDAAKMANLPIDPDAPPIGRMIMTATGPVWLDDVATPEMRKAQQQATMAGYQLVANPPAPKPGENEDEKKPAPGQKATQPDGSTEAMSRVTETLLFVEERLRRLLAGNETPEENDDEYRTQPHSEDEARSGADPGRADQPIARAGTQSETLRDGASGPDRKEVGAEYRRWRTRALEDCKAGRPQRPFVSALIPQATSQYIALALAHAPTADDVREVFERAKGSNVYPKATAADSGGNQLPNKSAWRLRW